MLRRQLPEVDVGINAVKLGVTALYAPDTKVPDDVKWNPLQPPGFEKGRYFEQLMKMDFHQGKTMTKK